MKILPPVLWGIFALGMIASGFVLPRPALIEGPARWAGAIGIAGGLALTLAGARLFGRRGTNIKTFDDPTVLVVDGPFRWTRNPMYLGFVVALLGLAVVIGNAASLAAAVVFAVIADRCYIAFEEQAMRRRFGAEYAAYAARVRRWL